MIQHIGFSLAVFLFALFVWAFLVSLGNPKKGEGGEIVLFLSALSALIYFLIQFPTAV